MLLKEVTGSSKGGPCFIYSPRTLSKVLSMIVRYACNSKCLSLQSNVNAYTEMNDTRGNILM